MTIPSIPAETTTTPYQQHQMTGEVDKLYKYVELEMRGNDKAVLSSYTKFATTAAQHLDIETKS